ncbi:hypothetical protein PR048_004334 [Dryococelus australis]|uniref:PiggyBac transposable element-derived protein domain-containing protein n=1 Tax=Dryococelus australis TaxID=614101 RepID=A0ABQ9I565_9NEOP|nr:hypothetical protein PR048_004334 [Dryococelus australis]
MQTVYKRKTYPLWIQAGPCLGWWLVGGDPPPPPRESLMGAKYSTRGEKSRNFDFFNLGFVVDGREGAKFHNFDFHPPPPPTLFKALWTGATKTGYIVWTDPYQCAKSNATPDYKQMGLGASIVLQYVDVLRITGQLNFHIFSDDFLNLIPLPSELRKRNIRGTGTIRENILGTCCLTHSNNINKTSRGKSETKVERSEGIVITKWNDNRVVTIASISAPATHIHKISRYPPPPKRLCFSQPHNIHIYNKNMGDVDKADQNISLYRISIRDTTMVNLDLLAFRRRLAISILEKNSKSTKSQGRPSRTDLKDSWFDGKDHWEIPQDKQTRCRMCHMRTTTRCVKCDVLVHVKCFLDYHTVK